MRHFFAHRVAIVWSLCLLVATNTTQAIERKYDGKWWSTRSAAEQEQFLWGYTDCQWDSLKRAAPDAGKYYVSYMRFRVEITKRYNTGLSTMAEPIGSVITAVLQHPNLIRAPAVLKGGETWTEKHGFLDGVYWNGSKDEERIGFITGEIACFNNDMESSNHFSKDPEEYVRLVNDWYEDAKNDERAKIPDVLFRFADKSRKAQPRK